MAKRAGLKRPRGWTAAACPPTRRVSASRLARDRIHRFISWSINPCYPRSQAASLQPTPTKNNGMNPVHGHPFQSNLWPKKIAMLILQNVALLVPFLHWAFRFLPVRRTSARPVNKPCFPRAAVQASLPHLSPNRNYFRAMSPAWPVTQVSGTTSGRAMDFPKSWLFAQAGVVQLSNEKHLFPQIKAQGT